ncbi:MAG TPA: xanthine dehydrogenase family protein subunit M [Acidimicrobiia bacterium]|nr:xanthine dehydrogenase family protein subunit M [Acidimicrobiia bacterium]
MYPNQFEYLAPTTLDEALSVLAERGDEVKVLAGGQSLIPMMKLRLANPTTLMDINRLPGLNNIGESNGHLTFGALVRHNDVVKSELAGRSNHTVATAAPWVADPIVRNLGTVCGSLAHHDPEGDWASVMLAAGAELVLSSSNGERVVPITEFLVDMFSTSCQPNELVTEVRVNKHSARGGGDYQKLERRIGDYATVGVATSLELGDDGAITNAGIALTSVYPYNLKVTEAEDLLVGSQPGEELFKEAGAIAAAASDPASDHKGSAEYKRHVVGVFVERGLGNSLAKADGGQS